ncbi:hypothetical protein CkP1_0120 [Citrobacter phage CkP1]|nr:hypothetical protein CkP1_0120 [Citrobacter phage CkP1]
MINREQKKEILYLVNEIITSQNNLDAELVTGHDWEHFESILKEDIAVLEQYLESITA